MSDTVYFAVFYNTRYGTIAVKPNVKVLSHIYIYDFDTRECYYNMNSRLNRRLFEPLSAVETPLPSLFHCKDTINAEKLIFTYNKNVH